MSISPILKIFNSGKQLLRIFNPTRYNTQATSFRHYGPISRFDHHRGSIETRDYDAERGINYWGCNLNCCLVEVFGDTGVIETENKEVASVVLTEPIQLLDLRGLGSFQAGADDEITQETAQRNLSQFWSRYFYEHSELYGEIDGLIWNSRYQETAIALYERAKPQLDSAKVNSLPLNHPGLEIAIAECAIKNNLIFDNP